MDRFDDALETLGQQTLLRKLAALKPISAVDALLDGRNVSLFSSNDYLGLSHHPDVIAAAQSALSEYGMGNRGAALICGYSELHHSLECDLARLKGAESALLFPTGYQANVGLLSALSIPGTVFFSDRLNHASIIDGIRLGKCPVKIYDHRDINHLDQLLEQTKAQHKIVVTDGLFSMDGDLAPLDQLADLKSRHHFTFVVDEAHATLVYGQNGGGLAEHFDVAAAVDFHVGTLSKAVGAQGGFVACSNTRRQWLLNTARAFIFTTALPTVVVAAAQAALRVASESPSIRRGLWERVRQLSNALGRELESPIAPIVLNSESIALEHSRALLERGFHVTAIRPPTVPIGTSRLRIALSAAHTEQQLNDLIDSLVHLKLCELLKGG